MSSFQKGLLFQYIGAIVWPSFLCASAATMFFFAMFDPQDLAPITAWKMEIDRAMGYTLGFFLFWILTVVSSGITAWLVYGFHLTRRKQSQPLNSG